MCYIKSSFDFCLTVKSAGKRQHTIKQRVRTQSLLLPCIINSLQSHTIFFIASDFSTIKMEAILSLFLHRQRSPRFRGLQTNQHLPRVESDSWGKFSQINSGGNLRRQQELQHSDTEPIRSQPVLLPAQRSCWGTSVPTFSTVSDTSTFTMGTPPPVSETSTDPLWLILGAADSVEDALIFVEDELDNLVLEDHEHGDVGRLCLRPEQRGAKDDGHVLHSHAIVVAIVN